MRPNRRYLGHPDADRDVDFSDHFVSSKVLRRISTAESDIVFGAKGVGKTALRRALTEIQSQLYHSYHTVSLDKVSFTQVHEALKDLGHTSKAEIAVLARNLWQNVISIFCLEAILNAKGITPTLADQVEVFLDGEGIRDPNPNQQILGVVDRILTLVAEMALQNQDSGALGLNKHQRKILNEFPYQPMLITLLEDCADKISSTGKRIAICLDGFDSIVDHTPESRKAIFAGLIDAIQRLSSVPAIFKGFCFKAFLPQELADVARALNWDADKHLSQTHYVSWGYQELQRFIAKRLAPFAKTKSGDFVNIWTDIFPDKVRNVVHKIDENSFSYIFRHTLHRPRHLLEHVQAILDEWDDTNESQKIDPTFIPGVVARTSKTLADLTIKQLDIAYPGTSNFIHSWRGQSNTATLASVRSRISKYFANANEAQTNAYLDFLYDFGVLGFAKRSTLATGVSISAFFFGSLSENLASGLGMQGHVEDEDVIALSPMLHNFCDCRPSDFGAINPTPR